MIYDHYSLTILSFYISYIGMDIIMHHMNQVPKHLTEAAFNHKHHIVSDTGSHSVLVAATAMRIGRLLKFDEKQIHRLVQAAIWHDIGIVDTNDMYCNWSERNRCHPKRSCELYRQYVPEFDSKVCDMISTHMWPFNIRNIPKSKEAWVLDFADDVVAIKDRFKLTGKAEKRMVERIKGRCTF